MLKRPRICHTDIPAPPDCGDAIREAARQTCGYGMGKDLFDARREIERTGGPEAIVKRAIERAERGGK